MVSVGHSPLLYCPGPHYDRLYGLRTAHEHDCPMILAFQSHGQLKIIDPRWSEGIMAAIADHRDWP
jgi:hypothetical protein